MSHEGCECCVQSDKRHQRAIDAEKREYEALQEISRLMVNIGEMGLVLKSQDLRLKRYHAALEKIANLGTYEGGAKGFITGIDLQKIARDALEDK